MSWTHRLDLPGPSIWPSTTFLPPSKNAFWCG
jgi:hypothetical protein